MARWNRGLTQGTEISRGGGVALARTVGRGDPRATAGIYRDNRNRRAWYSGIGSYSLSVLEEVFSETGLPTA